MSSLGLRMDDDAITVAIGLWLGTPLCHPHICHQCRSQVYEIGTHGLSCSKSQGRHSRHTAINHFVRHSLTLIKVPSHLEPSSIYHSDGKHPDRASIVLWKNGRVLVWVVTCADTFAPSYATKVRWSRLHC